MKPDFVFGFFIALPQLKLLDMNYEIRAMAPDDAQRVLDIFKQGIDGGNATFDTEVPLSLIHI